MKHSLQVINIKCSGCANTIKHALEKKGAFGISIDIKNGIVGYSDGPDTNEIATLLSHLGYPPVGSPEAESFMKKAQSYVSCAIGKIS